ncbi:MAG: ABC transporter substrate-binding protein [Chloroflexi bacterium]|nr:ABC transporter substrate-binding protein [Chloroflexota bacterium]
MMSDEQHKHYQKMDVPVDQPPRSVVSLVPSVTESLYDLNLGARLLAVTDYCVRPADKVARLPKIGGTKNPDVARIIALRPELVIANQEENRREDVEALRAAGVPVWVTFPKTVRDAMNLLWNIMYLFEETSMVPRVRLIEQTLDWVEGVSRAKEERVCKVFAPIWYEPLMTFNADTYSHDLLRVCGGTNIFAERERRYPLSADLGAGAPDAERAAGRDTRYPRVTLQEVAAAQPDVILLPSEPFPFTQEHIPVFAQLNCPAAKNGKIHLVDGSLLTWHGTRAAYALDSLPALLC